MENSRQHSCNLVGIAFARHVTEVSTKEYSEEGGKRKTCLDLIEDLVRDVGPIRV